MLYTYFEYTVHFLTELPSIYKPGYVPFQPSLKKRDITPSDQLPRIPGLADTPREKLYHGEYSVTVR